MSADECTEAEMDEAMAELKEIGRRLRGGAGENDAFDAWAQKWTRCGPLLLQRMKRDREIEEMLRRLGRDAR